MDNSEAADALPPEPEPPTAPDLGQATAAAEGQVTADVTDERVASAGELAATASDVDVEDLPPLLDEVYAKLDQALADPE